jgi:hypothetical protein
MNTSLAILTKSGRIINMTPWVDQIRLNIEKGYDPLEQTPIGKTAAGGYFWFDEDKNPALDKKSVNSFIKKQNAS